MTTPVTVLAGYLGVGKTTLLNHLLRNAGGRRIAVLVNDFGEIGIDGDLIESREAEVLNLSGGCVCCSFGSDLVGALGSITRRVPRPDHVVIETSGVALPEAVGNAVGLVPSLALDAVIVVVDASTVRQRAADRFVGDLVTMQLAQAHLIVVNKLDLVEDGRNYEDGRDGEDGGDDEDGGDGEDGRDGVREDEGGLKGLHAWLHRHAPAAPCVPACRGEVPLEVILGLEGAQLRPAAKGAALPFLANRMGLDGQLRRPVGPAAERFVSVAFRLPGVLDLGRLALDLADPGLGVLRAKGVLRDRDGRAKAFHVVGARAEARDFDHVQSDCGRLVCIGLRQGFDRATVADRVQAAVEAAAWPSPPDAPAEC